MSWGRKSGRGISWEETLSCIPSSNESNSRPFILQRQQEHFAAAAAVYQIRKLNSYDRYGHLDAQRLNPRAMRIPRLRVIRN